MNDISAILQQNNSKAIVSIQTADSLVQSLFTVWIPILLTVHYYRRKEDCNKEIQSMILYWAFCWVTTMLAFIMPFRSNWSTRAITTLISIWLWHPISQGTLFIRHKLSKADSHIVSFNVMYVFDHIKNRSAKESSTKRSYLSNI